MTTPLRVRKIRAVSGSGLSRLLHMRTTLFGFRNSSFTTVKSRRVLHVLGLQSSRSTWIARFFAIICTPGLCPSPTLCILARSKAKCLFHRFVARSLNLVTILPNISEAFVKPIPVVEQFAHYTVVLPARLVIFYRKYWFHSDEKINKKLRRSVIFVLLSLLLPLRLWFSEFERSARVPDLVPDANCDFR